MRSVRLLTGRRDYLIATQNGLGLYRPVKTATCISVIGPRLGHSLLGARNSVIVHHGWSLPFYMSEHEPTVLRHGT